ncbi:MAG: hypothetical protein LBG65_07945 [Puniceicoccales bacterium]|jgi:two-component system phosphate regulon sensor histidine kinase PhoR|nr:hypothetical protein [Puniceicoccales bacterium]
MSYPTEILLPFVLLAIITVLALALVRRIARLKKLEAMRKDFVANVSHELRTPLSIVKGVTETLIEEGANVAEADRERFLHTIQRHAERLASLLDDLLLLSRLESDDPGLRFEPVRLPDLLGAILGDYRARPAAEGRKITADIAPNVGTVRLDSSQITQVFENLLDNALKYTPAGSPVHLAARLLPGARDVEITLRDYGPGIPAADLPRIFERFYRVDKARSRETGGTGLGLSIVKHIVQLHGGSVRVTSPPGQGATFAVVLPLDGY